jgi:Domain of unknown function (DUF4389)
MTTAAARIHDATDPVRIDVAPALEDRNRLTVAFRPILALPHLILVGGPVAVVAGMSTRDDLDASLPLGAGGGALGAAAMVVAFVAWFAILFTGRYPRGLRELVVLYLRWRVRAVAYVTLLRDEYPPFGEGSYPTSLAIDDAEVPRNRLTVAFRLVLAIPHLVALWVLGLAWAVTTLAAWLAILFTGRMPRPLFRFGVGMLRWSTRVEAYLLLLHDDYPPFHLEMA